MDIDLIMKELDINAKALEQAISTNASISVITELMMQRSNLKDMLIELLLDNHGIVRSAA